MSGAPARRRGRSARGFTLIELMITVAVLALLASIAYPSYSSQLQRSRRASAATCLTDLATFMERVYASNLRYDLNGGVATALPATPCRSDLSGIYAFSFPSGQPQARTFTVQAVPAGRQAEDTRCATLSINQANVKAVSGSAAVADCWK